MAHWGRNGGAYLLSVYVGGLQALAKYGDHLGGYAPLDCAIRRFVRDRAHTVARPGDPVPIFGPLGAD